MNIERQKTDEIPEGATHYIKYDGGFLYMKKCESTWYRWVFQKEWWYCKPSLFVRIFRIKQL